MPSPEKTAEIFERLSKEYTLPKADIKTNLALFEVQGIDYAVFRLLRMEVEEHEYQNAIDVVENFRKEMDDFACNAKTGAANLIFSASYDVATYVLDALCKEEK